ncbi:LysR substrate-binding domain-containing protein [Rhodococcus sp. ACPA1]|uniref:LysR substrate-binding domain-containing protein n=2 Tax=unclassified Rhodococcus (in: high G+C Gram-positive bacteria) TaxID=192944 RepID=UPI000BB10A4D|nr:LysR substrate-binding domain-containing protein [Rhodococcus sp. ACPA1]PBC57900.1 LysR family transcriptional regulator [Rhodococcus sp. ACPA1]
MDFQQLRVFLAVAEELHFGRAAERLHLAQPPVSRIVRQLERDLGTDLFIRSTRSVRLTVAGAALVAPAQEMLAAEQRARATVLAADRGEAGTVTFAYAGASTHVLVGVLAREVRKAHPGIEFRLYSQDFALPALARVLRGEVDVSLGRWDFVPAGVRSRIIVDEHLVVAVPASHPLASKKEVHMAELAGEPFVALPPHEGSVLGDRLRRLSLGAGFDPDIVQRAPDSWTAMALVGAEVGCSLTVSSVAENVTDPHVHFLRVLDETLPIHLRMAWRPTSDNPALPPVLSLAERVWPGRPDDADSPTALGAQHS